MLKELTHNSVKHSGAKNVFIHVYFEESKLHIIYRDNGKGYLIGEVAHGLGHVTLKKRNGGN